MFRKFSYAAVIAATVVCGFAVPTPVSFAQEAEPAEAVDAHDAVEHAADGDPQGDHGEAGEVPMNFQVDLALWSLIVFILFLVVLKKLAWKPMIEGLDRREAGIRAAIAEAEENQRKSQALMADYEARLKGAEQKVAAMMAEAKRDAEHTSADIVARAQSDVESMRERAKDDISRAKDAALAEVFQSANRQVAAATERVLGRSLSDEDQDRLINEALQEIGT